MKNRAWILFAVFAALGLAYVVLFTEWLRPAPIEIAAQVRYSIQPPSFGRPPPVKKPVKPGQSATNRVSMPTNLVEAIGLGSNLFVRSKVVLGTNGMPRTNIVARTNKVARAASAVSGLSYVAPGGVANVTFSMDSTYELTKLRVEDVPADGSAPKILWRLAGKSVPTTVFLYGRDPEGLKPLVLGTTAEPLKPGVPYRLIVEAGRRRGTNNFTTDIVTH